MRKLRMNKTLQTEQIMKSEKEVQTEILKWVQSVGGYVIKVMKANTNGVPDLVICINGFFVGCEVKAERYSKDPSKQMSAWQQRHGKLIRASKGAFICCSTLEALKEYLEDELIYF